MPLGDMFGQSPFDKTDYRGVKQGINNAQEVLKGLLGEESGSVMDGTSDLNRKAQLGGILGDLASGGLGGVFAKVMGLVGAVIPGAMNKTKMALEVARAGSRSKPFQIAELTQKQFDEINALRKTNGAPPLPSRTIEYVGRHHNDSRSADGYEIKDMLKQLYSGLGDDAVADIDRMGRVGLKQPVTRHDGYGNKVNDLVTLNVDGNKVYAEALSAIPKGDKGNTPAIQMKKAGQQSPEFLSHPVSDGSRRMDGNQPTPSLVTEQDVRNWIAQDNAVKMLGLPKNNTAMDRAGAMGAIDLYHGSRNPNIESFDLSLAGKNTENSYGGAAWGSSNSENSNGYALNWDSYKTNPDYMALQQERNTLLPKIADAFRADNGEFARLRGSLDDIGKKESELYSKFMGYGLESEGSTLYPLKILDGKSFPVVDGGGANYMRVNNDAVDTAKSSGANGVVIRNVQDNAGTFKGTADSVAVFNPANIRSRFAAFDPMRRHEADLLGNINPALLGAMGIGSVGAATAATQLPEEYKTAIANAFGGN